MVTPSLVQYIVTILSVIQEKITAEDSRPFSVCLQSFQLFSVSAVIPCLSALFPCVTNRNALNEFNEHQLSYGGKVFYVQVI